MLNRPYGPYPLESDGRSVKIPVRDGASWTWARIDAGWLARANAHRWRINKDGYPCTSVFDTKARRATHLALHRLVANAPSGVLVDHRRGDKLDARRCMLRYATHSQNSANRRLDRRGRSSRFRGVTWHKQARKWQAGAKHRSVPGGKDQFHHAGLHASEEAAARAYNRLARRPFGSFAVLNRVSRRSGEMDGMRSEAA